MGVMIRGVLLAMMMVFFLLVTGCGSGAPSQANSVVGKIVDRTTGTPMSGVPVRLLNNSFKPYTSMAGALAKFGNYSAMNAYNELRVYAVVPLTLHTA